MNDPLIGQQLANFQIERLLGRGGMAHVYYGLDVKLDRPVAIKLIDARQHPNPAFAERFVREARTVARWQHEHIIPIYYADDQDGLYYFVMSYIDGGSLEDKLSALAGQLLPTDEVLRVGQAVAGALDYAHSKGVIHRDIKPSNVLLGLDGRIVLADFGLALDVNQGSIGETFGSARYIAPEQARRSSDAVPASDLYALGVMLYEMLTGRVPFDDPSPTATALQHLTLDPPEPRSLNSLLNPATDSVLLKALSKTPSERYESGQALMTALRRAIEDAPPLPVVLARPNTERVLARTDDLRGQQLDEYRIEDLLGKGGMARVYRALDINLERPVAIKVIDSPFRANDEYEHRFRLEARAVAQLAHPNIVRIYRYGQASHLLYIAMQYIEGDNLRTKLTYYQHSQTFMPRNEVVRIIKAVCSALDYAHQHGVIHRDVKPSNIMLSPEQEVYLTDFGLALLTDVGTRGEILGSPYYVAPEQAVSSANVTAQSDLYALGVILFEMLTNERPFNAEQPLELAMQHMTQLPPRPTSLRPELPLALEQVMLLALAKEPTERYATGEAFVQALEAAWADHPSVPMLTEQSQPPTRPLPPTPLPIAPPAPEMDRTAEMSIMTKIAWENPTTLEPPEPAKRTVRPSLAVRGLQFAIAFLILVIIGAGGYLIATTVPTPAEPTNAPTATHTPVATSTVTATITPTQSSIITTPENVGPTKDPTNIAPAERE